MKKFLLIVVSLSISSSAFAIKNQDLARTCWSRGVEKLVLQAQAKACSLNPMQVQVCGVDNRLMNPSKYVWYETIVLCPQRTKIVQMVQYSHGQCL